MHLHIIQPTTYTTDGQLFQTGKRRLMSLSLPYLAALTPRMERPGVRRAADTRGFQLVIPRGLATGRTYS